MVRPFLFSCLITVLFSSLAIAQSASVKGKVTTSDSKAVVGTLVSLGDVYAQISTKKGEFSFQNVEAGTYVLKIKMLGFKEYTKEIELREGESINLPITLEEKIYQQEAIIVTASRTEKDIEDVSVPVAVITKEEIAISGNNRLSTVLAEQTGFNIVSDHGTGIQVQGFDPEYTLIMIDNQPVIGRTAGTLDLTRLAVGDVKQIETVKGPSSALWGSEALAGVINIITEQGSDPFNLDVSSQYGSNDSYDFGSTVSFNNDAVNGRFFGNINGSGGYDLTSTTIAPTVPQYQSYTFSNNVTYKASESISLGINSRYYLEDQNFRNQLTVDNLLRDIDSDEFQENYSISPSAKIVMGSKQLLELTAYITRFRSENELTFSDNGGEFSSSSFDQVLQRYEAKSSTFWNQDHVSVFGGGWNREDLTSENYSDISFFDSFFAFGQHEWSLSQKLSLVSGFRFDTHSEYASQLSPKLSGLYKPSNVIHLRASLGSGFKAPAFRQLFLNFTNPTVGYSVFGTSNIVSGIQQLQNSGEITNVLINPNQVGEIEAERSFAYNAGFDLFPVSGVQLRVNVFRNNVRDLIETQRIALKTNGQSVFSYLNLNRIFTQGFEAEVRIKPASVNGLSIVTGYQFLDSQQRIERVFDDVVNGTIVSVTELDWVPLFNRSKHTGNVRVFYNIDHYGLETSVRAQFRGRFGFADFNSNNEIDGNEWAERNTIINASVAKNFSSRYRLQFGVNNITNYQNAQFLPSNPGMTFYTQLNIKLY